MLRSISNIPQTEEAREFLVHLFHKHHIPKIAIDFGSMKMLRFSQKLMGSLFSCASRSLDSMLRLVKSLWEILSNLDVVNRTQSS